MRKIPLAADRTLKWSQPSALKKQFELHDGQGLVATLKFRSLFGSFATAESGDGCWTMKRTGFFVPRVTVRECGSETDIASYREKTWGNGGTLTFADGRELFAATSFWKSRLTFQDARHEEIVILKPGGLVHYSANVEITTAGRKRPETPLLVLLGCYLVVQNRDEDALGGAAAAAGS